MMKYMRDSEPNKGGASAAPVSDYAEAVACWQRALADMAHAEKIPVLMRFFKTGPGKYGEGDRFLGIYVPDNRRISKAYHALPLSGIESMLRHDVHEFRLAGFLALVERYRRARSEAEREETVDFYLAHGHMANNWDLVDLSTEYILGEEIAAGRRLADLHRVLESECLWLQRIGVVAMLTPIRKGQLELPLEVASRMLGHPHELMRKATGWILREAGKKDEAKLRDFLERNIGRISAITLSYATERLPKTDRARLRAIRKASAG